MLLWLTGVVCGSQFFLCLYLPPLLDSAYYAIVKGHIDVTIVLYTVSRIDFKG